MQKPRIEYRILGLSRQMLAEEQTPHLLPFPLPFHPQLRAAAQGIVFIASGYSYFKAPKSHLPAPKDYMLANLWSRCRIHIPVQYSSFRRMDEGSVLHRLWIGLRTIKAGVLVSQIPGAWSGKVAVNCGWTHRFIPADSLSPEECGMSGSHVDTV